MEFLNRKFIGNKKPEKITVIKLQTHPQKIKIFIMILISTQGHIFSADNSNVMSIKII